MINYNGEYFEDDYGDSDNERRRLMKAEGKRKTSRQDSFCLSTSTKISDKASGDDTPTGNESKSGNEGLTRKTKACIYVSHFLSKWGDRMWQFGVGLFLIDLAPESLQLTAIYGFASGGAVLLFAALIGDWVDNTARLTAARCALVVQNLSVALCAIVVCIVFWFNSEIAEYWPDLILLQLCHGIIIFIAIIANLASIAGTIAMEKDWLVQLCGSDRDLLANMSATMRSIDQTCLILAPALTGQIIGLANLGYGAVFIAAWNVISVVVEYFLIWKVYENVPALKNKMYSTRKEKGISDEVFNDEGTTFLDNDKNSQYKEFEDSDDAETECGYTHILRKMFTSGNSWETYMPYDRINPSTAYMTTLVYDDAYSDLDIFEHKQASFDETEKTRRIIKNDGIEYKSKKTSNSGCCSDVLRKMFKSFITLHVGWRTYRGYDVAYAGIALSCLYMTVLGFDNVTVGYAYLQGINESLIGILMAVGAVTGLLGTIVYPIIRKRLGLERSGFVGLFAEIFTLCACVVSVWAPGSPFDPFYLSRSSIENVTMTTYNQNRSNVEDSGYTTAVVTNKTQEVMTPIISEQDSYLSIGLLLGGIVTARFGLWLSDLTISQLFLENVKETERGIVNGVQNALNQLMGTFKFLLVILVPQPELFGFLILTSFGFICLGLLFYARYSYSTRGHLFHFDKLCNKAF